MASYREATFLHQQNHAAFNNHYSPGVPAIYGGIYRCISCGHEATVPIGHTLPPQNHSVHPAGARIMWQLISVAHGRFHP